MDQKALCISSILIVRGEQGYETALPLADLLKITITIIRKMLGTKTCITHTMRILQSKTVVLSQYQGPQLEIKWTTEKGKKRGVLMKLSILLDHCGRVFSPLILTK